MSNPTIFKFRRPIEMANGNRIIGIAKYNDGSIFPYDFCGREWGLCNWYANKKTTKRTARLLHLLHQLETSASEAGKKLLECALYHN